MYGAHFHVHRVLLTLYGVNESIVCMTIWTTRLTGESGPLYKELADAIERDIADGKLLPGERLPTHRELADELGMNVSTVTRGYREAEKRGLLSGTVGRGTFVAADAATSTALVSFEPCRPGLIEMGLVSPLHHMDPDVADGFRRIARRRDPGAFMRYTDPRGLPEHRQAGAQWAARYGLETTPEDVIVCAGAQHALTCTLSGLLRSGDRIATDALTYPGMKTLAAMLGIRLVPIAMDEHGMNPDRLDAACRRDKIKGVYLMPGVHNPTTVTMNTTRRRDIAQLAQKHDLIIIEDDAYDLTVPGHGAAGQQLRTGARGLCGRDVQIHCSRVARGLYRRAAPHAKGSGAGSAQHHLDGSVPERGTGRHMDQ